MSSSTNGFIGTVGGRRTVQNHNSNLLDFRLQVWEKMRLQTSAYHHLHNILPPVTINAMPPSSTWSMGRYDPALVNIDQSQVWPNSGLSGDYLLIFIRI